MEELEQPWASLYCLDRISPEKYFRKYLSHLDESLIDDFVKSFNLPNIPIPGINPPEIITPNPVKWTKKNGLKEKTDSKAV